MTKTICDLCDDDRALKSGTGFYVLIVRKVTKDDGESQTHFDVEYDVCGACMAMIRKARPAVK